MENPSVEQHESPEQFPSQEEIRSVFETVLKGKAYKELPPKSDRKGVRVYEIEVTMEDGERWEYNYQRSAPGYIGPVASIHVTKYDTDGMPHGGDTVANYLNGEWQYVDWSP